jgi:hypothetical protein
MIVNVKSLRVNIYATNFGWSRAFPIAKIAEVHETLDLFVSRYGIPEALAPDNAQAYIGGTVKK